MLLRVSLPLSLLHCATTLLLLLLPPSRCRSLDWSTYDTAVYYGTDDITDLCKSTEAYRRDIATARVIGHTSENREICMTHINDQATDGPKKLAIFIEAGIHGREWVSPSSALFLTSTLLDKTNPVGSALLKAAEFYIVPLLNPDGYEYTHTHARKWRKNRNRCENAKDKCCGVDVNRNFNSHFGEINASPYKCATTYRGPYFESERESYALVSEVLRIKHKLDVYVALHSYGQSVLVPYGFAKEAYPDNYDDMLRVAKKTAEEMSQAHGHHYRATRRGRTPYVASGCTDDWAREQMQIPYSYTFELRPEGPFPYGFELPARMAPFVGEELTVGLTAMIGEINRIERERAQ